MILSTDIPGRPVNEAALSPTLAAVAQIEGFDIQLALSRISGKQQVLESTIKQTTVIIETMLKKMSDHLAAQDLRGFFVEIHGLKGALGSIGAIQQAALAAGLEAQAKAGDDQGCLEHFPSFVTNMYDLVSQLRAAFPAEQVRERQPGQAQLLTELAGQAANSLEVFEADEALELLQRLDQFSFGEEADALLKQIQHKISLFKYGEAIWLLRTIADS